MSLRSSTPTFRRSGARQSRGPSSAPTPPLDLASEGVSERFDAIVSAGNMMTFLDPATRRDVLHRLLVHLAPDGRLAVGLRNELRLSSWDLRPFGTASTFLVTVLTSR